MSTTPLKPIEIHLGYTNDKKLYLDLFLRCSSLDD